MLADLDDTLFDHRHATREALAVLHADVPAFQSWALEEFTARHSEMLELIHQLVMAGRMNIEQARITRFQRLLDATIVPPRSPGRPTDSPARPASASDLARQYRQQYELAWRAVPGAMALAEAVKRAGLAFVIVTNNITSEQVLKIEHCGLRPYVDALITSEAVGVTKPDGRIFEAALTAAGVKPAEAVMLGDSWLTDVAGARAAGLRAVWLNRAGVARPDSMAGEDVAEIQSLEPLADVWRVLIG